MQSAEEREFQVKLGSAIARRRVVAQMTQVDLALATGLSHSGVSQIEVGNISVRLASLQKLADVLGVNAATLLREAAGVSESFLR